MDIDFGKLINKVLVPLFCTIVFFIAESYLIYNCVVTNSWDILSIVAIISGLFLTAMGVVYTIVNLTKMN